MLRALQEDNAFDAEALLLAGLDVDTTFDGDAFNSPQIGKGSTLIHAAAVFDALHCARVRSYSSRERTSVAIIQRRLPFVDGWWFADVAERRSRHRRPPGLRRSDASVHSSDTGSQFCRAGAFLSTSNTHIAEPSLTSVSVPSRVRGIDDRAVD